jgi:DNA-binding transcriptional LysR family regulator
MISDMRVDDVRKLDGRLLLVFRELLRHRSATVAAGHLGLGQPAVSHALGRLRAQFGDPLFVRRPHGLEPTRRALELAPGIEAILELAGELHREHDAFDPATSDRVFRIAAPEFVTATIGGALLERWSSTAPGVSLVTHQLGPDQIVDGLRRGDLDLAVGRFADRPRPGVQLDLLYEDRYCVVVRLDHPTIGARIDPRTYRRAGHVLASGPSEAAADEGVPKGIRVTAVVPAWLTALSIVATSNAIATCPRLLAERHGGRLGLRLLAVPGGRFGITVHLLRRDGPADAATAWLGDELRQVTRQARR